MPSSKLEDRGWPDPVPRIEGTYGGSTRLWSALCWGVSCIVHLLLLVAVGVLSRQIIDAPQAPPIRVSMLPTMGTSPQPLLVDETHVAPLARLPERQAADPTWPPISPVDPDPVLSVMSQPPRPALAEPERAIAAAPPENLPLELLDVMPEIEMDREAPPLIEPRRDKAPDRWSPHDVAAVAPLTPPPVAPAPMPRLPRPSLAREPPKRGRPPTTFDDALMARLPSAAQSRREPPPAAAPDIQDKKPPQPSVPRSSGVRYGQNPTPSYPPEARRRGWEGAVLLLVEILESGRPERITIKQSSGHPLLDEAARGAVGRWLFIPAQREGKPVRSFAEVPIVFALRKD